MDVVWLFVKPQSAHRCSKALPQAGTHTHTHKTARRFYNQLAVSHISMC